MSNRGKFTPVPLILNDKTVWKGRGRFSTELHQIIADTKTVPQMVNGVWQMIEAVYPEQFTILDASTAFMKRVHDAVQAKEAAKAEKIAKKKAAKETPADVTVITEDTETEVAV
jgi:hypothetical protein